MSAKYQDIDTFLNDCDQASMRQFGCISLDLVDDQDRGVDILKDAYMSDDLPSVALTNLRLAQCKELWSSLGNVPVDHKDRLQMAFMDFPSGTQVEDVWKWFEETYNVSVAVDLMGLAGDSD